MSDYRVNLDVFSGPLDLLLYLVRKDEVDIYDIPLAEITDQYIRYIEILKSLDVDLAGDFLVMAATLMQIKSAMLLPKADPEQVGTEDFSDPRTELIRQLLEYKKFKDAANLLGGVAEEQQMRFPRPDTIIEHLYPNTEPQIDIEQVSIWDLLEAFDLIMKATGANLDIHRIHDDTPIDLYQIEILHRLQTEGPMSFERIFESRNNRIVMIGLFLALLELIRGKLVSSEQAGDLGSIYLVSLTDEPAEQAVQKAIIAPTFEETGKDRKKTEETNEKQVPIAIVELPQKSDTVVFDTKQQEKIHIPISELPPENKLKTLSEQHSEESVESEKNPL